MLRHDGPWVQLTTKISKNLHRELKLHCVVTETSQVRFVVAAIREKLDRVDTHKRTRRVG